MHILPFAVDRRLNRIGISTTLHFNLCINFLNFFQYILGFDVIRLKGKASSTKVKNLASDIHYELSSMCKNSSTLYKQKASSLLRIFKRSSSQVGLCPL